MSGSPEIYTSPACGCLGYSRAQLLRGAAAEAGNGLPGIEPGMPLPAGTGLSRRGFLLRSAGLAMTVYGGAALAPRALEAGIEDAMAAAPSDAVLVVIFLPGGIDSMSVLCPTGHAQYGALRPRLSLTEAETLPFTEDPALRWHASAAPLGELHGEGKVAVLPAVGYTGGDQSHFTSRHYWEVGETNAAGRIGWLGRYLDRHGAASNPLQGLTIGGKLAPSLATATNPVATVLAPDKYTFDPLGVGAPIGTSMLDQFGALANLPTADPGLHYARAATAASVKLRQDLAGLGAVTVPPSYPANSRFASQMAGLAAMLSAGLPLRCVAIDAPGIYDTHANQESSLAGDLAEVSGTLNAFQRDLEQRGQDGRVVTLVWSEFGRRPQENGSGTDHGAAGIGMLIGTRVNGQMVGSFPGLQSGTGGGLDSFGNLRATSDFRSVYRTLIEDWLGVDADGIIPGAPSFEKYSLVT
jgi:uncharacterized protein (DUF1501 family)